MAAHQAPPSLGFSRKEHWSGLPFPSPMHESEKWKWSRSVADPPKITSKTRFFPWSSISLSFTTLCLPRCGIPEPALTSFSHIPYLRSCHVSPIFLTAFFLTSAVITLRLAYFPLAGTTSFPVSSFSSHNPFCTTQLKWSSREAPVII